MDAFRQVGSIAVGGYIPSLAVVNLFGNTADVETDEITAIEYEKTADVKTTVTGKGNLESIGTLPVIFNYRSNVRYSLDWTDPATATTLAEK